MIKIVALWLLCGAFTASAALNVYHAKTLCEVSAPCAIRDASANAQGEPCCGLVDKVGLTATQRQQLTECCPSYMRRRAQLHTKVDELVARLDQELFAKEFDTKRIDKLVEKIGEVRVEELKSRVSSILLVRKTLTPNQLERLAGCCGRSE